MNSEFDQYKFYTGVCREGLALNPILPLNCGRTFLAALAALSLVRFPNLLMLVGESDYSKPTLVIVLHTVRD